MRPIAKVGLVNLPLAIGLIDMYNGLGVGFGARPRAKNALD
ncbi:hypothetical protein [Aquisediminimonas profunda]|nr:hypothetical protein [Aquisediminimonas profunda]